jgi:hypothetical protein
MEVNAMALAIKTFRNPSRNKFALRELPKDILTVIKAAAGDEATLAQQAEFHNADVKLVHEAARHYLLTLLMDPKSRGLRIIGLAEDASESEIKDHKRWLLKWLHPDRNSNAWEQALFHKVSAAKAEHPKDVLNEVSLAKSDIHSSPPRKRNSPKVNKVWQATESRKRDVSVRRMVLQFLKPIVFSVAIVGLLIWSYSAHNSNTANPFSFLNQLAGP